MSALQLLIKAHFVSTAAKDSCIPARSTIHRRGPKSAGLQWRAMASQQPAESGQHKTEEGAAGQTQELRETQPSDAAATELTEAYADDMEVYGSAYATRSEDEGFGQIYGEPVHMGVVGRHGNAPVDWAVNSDKVEQAERSATPPGSAEYDRTQGAPVAEKEHGRHAEREDATSETHKSESQTGMAT